MTQLKLVLILSLLSASVFTGCKDDEDDPSTPGSTMRDLTLNITGLKDLGSSAQYEGWIIVNGNPVSTGRFTVNQSGALSRTTFSVDASSLSSATAFVLTIEPQPDNSPAADQRHLIAGDFSNNTATLSAGDSKALGVNLGTATGSYILATPTDGGMTSDELSGVWFLNPGTPAMGDETAGLTLPALPSGWIYEGWAVINGTPVTTGKFSNVNQSDQSGIYSGNQPGPPFPGEDFLTNAPTGLTFPTNLQSDTIVVTLEPVPDNEAKPFFIKPLSGTVSSNAMDHTMYTLNNAAASSLPMGTVSR